MLHEFSRTEMLIGKDGLARLKAAKVAVFGVGGVGTFVVEALARSGLGALTLVDNDCICLSNINRQLHASQKTLGKPKVQVMKERILVINPEVQVTTFQEFYLPENAAKMIAADYDYIVDAVDTVTAKIDLVLKAQKYNIPVISSMGTGNKLDPTQFEVTDIYKTSMCPLAKVIRSELRKRGVKKLKVVYSREKPLKPIVSEVTASKKPVPGSIAFVPGVAGLIIAGEVIKDIALGKVGV